MYIHSKENFKKLFQAILSILRDYFWRKRFISRSTTFERHVWWYTRFRKISKQLYRAIWSILRDYFSTITVQTVSRLRVKDMPDDWHYWSNSGWKPKSLMQPLYQSQTFMPMRSQQSFPLKNNLLELRYDAIIIFIIAHFLSQNVSSSFAISPSLKKNSLSRL